MSTQVTGSSLSDNEFVYAFADEYFGSEVDTTIKTRFDSLIAKDEYKGILDKYKEQQHRNRDAEETDSFET